METPNLTEALVGSSGMVPTTHNKHDPPKHQHSAASLLSSVAAASVAMASMDSSSSVATMVPTGTTNSIPPTLSTTTITGPTPTVGAVASATVSTMPTTVSSASLSTKNEPSGTISSGTISADMETKCTQTKLDDELLEPIMGCSASFNSATSCGSEYQKTTTSSNPSTTVEQNPKSISAEPKSGSAGSKSGSSGPKAGSVNEPTTIGISEDAAGSNPAIATTSEQPSKSIGPTENNPGKSGNPSSTTDPSTKSGVPPAENPKSGSAATATESKGEIGTWTSSTEVCPWEDEENRRESHAPFVKTYATLGYL